MGKKASRLNSFVAPVPNRALIGLMTPVNRILMLKGVPLLRDLPPLNRVPGFRGIANVRQIDFPDADCARLAAVCGAGKATFLTPNHPEFFTDWMIDKYVVSKVSPLAASWATNGVVNGLGPVAQKFWLANNLIAQIPGSNGAARDHSVSWAAQGHGVLLHPEGMVGWHGDWVAPLMPGAAEMAAEALDRGRAADSAFQAWIAPIVWKFKFLRDVDAELGTECAYVEGRLKIAAPRPGSTPAERIHAIYGALLEQEEERAGLAAQRDAVFPHAWRRWQNGTRRELLKASPACQAGKPPNCCGPHAAGSVNGLMTRPKWPGSNRRSTHFSGSSASDHLPGPAIG